MATKKSNTPKINTLSALNRASDQVSRGDSYFVDPRLLVEEDGFNTRDYSRADIEAHIENLTNAYLAGHFVPPVVVIVKDGKPIVRDGHCRRKAMMRAIERGAELKKVHVLQFAGDESDQAALILTSNSGMQLNPLERGEVYLRLQRWGLSIKEIAEKVTRTSEHVRQLLDLQCLPIKIKTMIRNNQVSSTYALECWHEYGDEAIDILEQAKQDAEKLGKSKVTKATVKKSQESSESEDTTGQAQNGKKTAKPMRIGKKTVKAMSFSLHSLYLRAKDVKTSSDSDEVTITLTRDELEHLIEVGKELDKIEAEELASESSNENQLHLIDNHEEVDNQEEEKVTS